MIVKAVVGATMGALSLPLILIPFFPGVRDIPRWIPLLETSLGARRVRKTRR